MKKWYQKSIAVVMAAACLFVGGTIGLARDSLPQLQLTAEAEDKLYTGESDGLQLNYEELEDGTIEITKFVDSTSTDIELPAVIDGKSVTSIGERAFEDCVSLTSVTIPDGVTSIGNLTFSGCISLTNIRIPDSVMYIGDQVFYDCFSLTNITIPDNITSIGNGMFFNCYSLTNLIIPDNVFDIEWSAFYGCTSLTTITIPEHVISINDSAFSACSCLTEIIVDSGNNSYASQDGVLFSKNLETLICCPEGKTGTFIIPDNVTNIENFAFYRCSNLISIVIPDDVKIIECCTFYDCNNLISIVIPNSVTSIGDSAFYGCDNLMNIHYKGTKSEWNKISIGDFAIPSDTMIHYKSEPAKSNLPTIRGDVDGNNTVEVSDAVKILNYYSQKAAGLNPVFSETAAENEAIFDLADVDKDGEITVQDAVLILTYYAKAASGGQPTWEQLTSA